MAMVGKVFTLISAVLAVDAEHERTSIIIPPNAIFTITRDADERGMVEAHWNERTIRLFAADITKCGVEIPPG